MEIARLFSYGLGTRLDACTLKLRGCTHLKYNVSVKQCESSTHCLTLDLKSTVQKLVLEGLPAANILVVLVLTSQLCALYREEIRSG